MNAEKIERETVNWYKERYEKKGKYIDSLLKDPEVLFQVFAYDRALIKALSAINIDIESARILDVGCGGGSLINFIRLGFPPENIVGIDIQKERIEEAKRRFPNIKFVHGDASKMQFNDESFDIVTELTVFVQITDDGSATSIANEMIRVTKIWGYIILVDWRYSKPWDKSYKGMSQRRD
ncbi:MAG: class I SAM-dependent methyltransferase [candidate division WOR-3 bacterium]